MKTTDLPANDKILQPRPHQSIIHARAASSAAQKPRWQKKAACFIELIQYISFVKCVCCFSTQFVSLNHNICVLPYSLPRAASEPSGGPQPRGRVIGLATRDRPCAAVPPPSAHERVSYASLAPASLRLARERALEWEGRGALTPRTETCLPCLATVQSSKLFSVCLSVIE